MTTPRREQVNTLTVNAPTTAAGLSAAVAAVIVALTEWGLDTIDVPDTVAVAVGALTFAVASLIGAAAGRYAQKWTYPQVLDPELVDLGADPLPPIEGQSEKRQGQMVRPQLGDVPDYPDDIP